MKKNYLEILHIGGHNPILRKQTDKVIDSFLVAAEKRQDIKLTVTVIGRIPERYNNITNKRVRIIRGELSELSIEELYLKCDYIIQVPTHEGLGLDFYEAIKYFKPVLTLDAPPNNEVINEKNGWLLKCISINNVDNPYGITKSYLFNTNDLAILIEEITREKVEEKAKFIESSEKEISGKDYLQQVYFALNSNSLRLFDQKFDESISTRKTPKYIKLFLAVVYIFSKNVKYLPYYKAIRSKIKNLIVAIEKLWL